MSILLTAVLLGLGSPAAIPGPVTPAWNAAACTDAGYAPFDMSNVRITDVSQNGPDVVITFRVELFIGDSSFPPVSNRGMIFTQLDRERGTYLAVRTRPEDDQKVAYTHLTHGPHRFLVELATASTGLRRSFGIVCFNVM
jgi:hypothetical protein